MSDTDSSTSLESFIYSLRSRDGSERNRVVDGTLVPLSFRFSALLLDESSDESDYNLLYGRTNDRTQGRYVRPKSVITFCHLAETGGGTNWRRVICKLYLMSMFFRLWVTETALGLYEEISTGCLQRYLLVWLLLILMVGLWLMTGGVYHIVTTVNLMPAKDSTAFKAALIMTSLGIFILLLPLFGIWSLHANTLAGAQNFATMCWTCTGVSVFVFLGFVMSKIQLKYELPSQVMYEPTQLESSASNQPSLRQTSSNFQRLTFGNKFQGNKHASFLKKQFSNTEPYPDMMEENFKKASIVITHIMVTLGVLILMQVITAITSKMLAIKLASQRGYISI